MATQARTDKLLDTEFYVEGYAANFERYLLFEMGEIKVYEQIERGAFSGCDMSDVIFRYDHSGRVFARQKNGTLLLSVNDVGLFVAADLGKTEGARQMYSDIEAGMIDKMSWAFATGEYRIDEEGNDITIIHSQIRKMYDVSAVSIPANDTTDISVRSWVDGVIDLRRRSDRERENKIKAIQTKIKISEVIN